jgi:hypothetical protein
MTGLFYLEKVNMISMLMFCSEEKRENKSQSKGTARKSSR